MDWATAAMTVGVAAAGLGGTVVTALVPRYMARREARRERERVVQAQIGLAIVSLIQYRNMLTGLTTVCRVLDRLRDFETEQLELVVLAEKAFSFQLASASMDAMNGDLQVLSAELARIDPVQCEMVLRVLPWDPDDVGKQMEEAGGAYMKALTALSDPSPSQVHDILGGALVALEGSGERVDNALRWLASKHDARPEPSAGIRSTEDVESDIEGRLLAVFSERLRPMPPEARRMFLAYLRERFSAEALGAAGLLLQPEVAHRSETGPAAEPQQPQE